MTREFGNGQSYRARDLGRAATGSIARRGFGASDELMPEQQRLRHNIKAPMSFGSTMPATGGSGIVVIGFAGKKVEIEPSFSRTSFHFTRYGTALLVESSTQSDWLDTAQNVAKEQPLSLGQIAGRKTGPVQFFEKLLEIWGLNAKQGATLLGFENVSQVHDLLSGAATLRSRDAKDRVRCLIEIRSSLNKLFRNEGVEKEWLNEKRKDLDGNSPLEQLLEGSMESMLRVKQLVQYISGR